jgi:tetratricopeptide (TPR) repeat protein/S1-C subfamily serine protease
MYRSSLFLTIAVVGSTVLLIQPVASAKSASEVEAIAHSVTMEISFKFKAADGRIVEIGGSGVIVDRTGDLYTLVTNRHVVCGGGQCSKLPPVESYNLSLSNSSTDLTNKPNNSPTVQRYQVKKSNVKFLGKDLDLAIIQFHSNRNHKVAKLSAANALKTDDKIYTAGFPTGQPGFTFGKGEAVAVVNTRLMDSTGIRIDDGGYTIVYNSSTLPGMSGSGVFDSNGQLVAIHGQGDKFKENTEIDNKSEIDSKIGINRGIPVRWLVQSLAEFGINLGGGSLSKVKAARPHVPTTADEYFIAGFNKFVEPGDNIIAGKRLAIRQFDKAIQNNPRYDYAYFMRAILYRQLQDFQSSLNDYNQTISLKPRSISYNNRALLKKDKLNDFPGALSDYNQAILIDPEFYGAYNNRAVLKETKLDDIQGALADYNQAILINPKFADAYNNRALLKKDKINDMQGALVDLNQAISISPNNSIFYYNRALLKVVELNDFQGAFADYNQAISINPKYAEAYSDRALLRDIKLNDFQGALTDYNQAISINPKLSYAYYNRANLKYVKLKDRLGAIQDFRQAAKLFREQGNTSGLTAALNDLRQLGVTE